MSFGKKHTNREELIAKLKRPGFIDVPDLSDAEKDDDELGLLLVKNNGRYLQHLSSKLKKDKNIVLSAVSNSPQALYYADESLKRDKDIVLMCVKRTDQINIYIEEDLRSEPYVVEQFIKYHFDRIFGNLKQPAIDLIPDIIKNADLDFKVTAFNSVEKQESGHFLKLNFKYYDMLLQAIGFEECKNLKPKDMYMKALVQDEINKEILGMTMDKKQMPKSKNSRKIF